MALERLIKDERGADATEYALLAALIAVVIIAAVSAIGHKLNGMLDLVQSNL
jgi:pilus assembly protein Flp/PilA